MVASFASPEGRNKHGFSRHQRPFLEARGLVQVCLEKLASRWGQVATLMVVHNLFFRILYKLFFKKKKFLLGRSLEQTFQLRLLFYLVHWLGTLLTDGDFSPHPHSITSFSCLANWS
jgi:hypothetical protein